MTSGSQGWHDDFQDDARESQAIVPDDLVVELDNYEGPISLLLEQARSQKVDLSRISVLALADQYLAFVEMARGLRIELAADYLVMAAWLAYLKSKLLLPPDQRDDSEPSGEEMAADLTRRLRRLDAMRRAGECLMQGRLLNRDWYGPGLTGGIQESKSVVYQATLYDLLTAWAEHRRPAQIIDDTYRKGLTLVSVDDAQRRMSHLLGVFPGWNRLEGFLPRSFRDGLHARSALASHFGAALQLAKAGVVDIHQDRPFAPIRLRATSRLAQEPDKGASASGADRGEADSDDFGPSPAK